MRGIIVPVKYGNVVTFVSIKLYCFWMNIEVSVCKGGFFNI